MKKEETKNEVVELKERLDKLVEENLLIIYYLITTNVGLLYRKCNFDKFAKITYSRINLSDIFTASDLLEKLADEDISKIVFSYKCILIYLAIRSTTIELDTKGDAKPGTEDRYERNIKINNVLNNTFKRIEKISKYYVQFPDTEKDFIEHLTISIIIELEKEEFGTIDDLLGEISFDDIKKENGGI